MTGQHIVGLSCRDHQFIGRCKTRAHGRTRSFHTGRAGRSDVRLGESAGGRALAPGPTTEGVPSQPRGNAFIERLRGVRVVTLCQFNNRVTRQ